LQLAPLPKVLSMMYLSIFFPDDSINFVIKLNKLVKENSFILNIIAIHVIQLLIQMKIILNTNRN
jgi:hypothetical protein